MIFVTFIADTYEGEIQEIFDIKISAWLEKHPGYRETNRSAPGLTPSHISSTTSYICAAVTSTFEKFDD